jgi:hypothetical protein
MNNKRQPRPGLHPFLLIPLGIALLVFSVLAFRGGENASGLFLGTLAVLCWIIPFSEKNPPRGLLLVPWFAAAISFTAAGVIALFEHSPGLAIIGLATGIALGFMTTLVFRYQRKADQEPSTRRRVDS